MNRLTILGTLAVLGITTSGAAHAVVHAASLVTTSVPVDSPWTTGTLAVLVAVIVARALNNRNR